ncbi:MAG: PKD domain-containing protein [Saprospiraceae bacterium]|nr:PKD domain-containing protein [Saprospiraceae bacterium]
MKSIIFILFIIISCWPNEFVFTQVNADFVYDKAEGCGSLAVNFKDQSTTNSGSIIDWKWNMGGVISSKQNPGIIFTSPGQYTICLTITTSSGATSSTCKNNIIHVYEQPVANFSVDQISGCNPLFVSFTDLSASQNGNIVSWTWDIGGSSNVITTSDGQQDIHTTYSSAGNYTGTLSITDVKGCKNIITKPNIVQVIEIPKLNIDYSFLSSCALPWDVSFTNLDPDLTATYKWDFGNGQTFTGASPNIVTYSESKKYTIRVIVTKGPCIDTIIFENLINTNRNTDFFIQSDVLCEDQVIHLRDTSNYVADSLIWDFGDGNKSKENHPQHIYSSPGCYTVKLTKYVGTCIQMVEKPCINIVPKPEVTFNILNEFSCIIPANLNMQSSSNEKGQFSWHLLGVDLDTTFNTQNQQFVLDKFGNYTVSLAFMSEKGCNVQFDNIKVDIAKFEASLPFLGPRGCVPYEAILTDSIVSNTPVIKWQWDVGNPIIFTSAEKNPVFPISEVGRWDLRLIVENIYGCKDTILLPEYIRGGTKPIIDFDADPLLGCLDVSRQFTSLCSSNADFWIWSQNGTFFSFEENPAYVFPDFGVFDVGLTAMHNGCSSSLTKEDFITVYKPKSAFKVDYNCDDPYTINITNQSIGADSLYWVVRLSSSIKDTIRDSLLHSYTFPGRGLYFLSHFAKSFETGCEHIFTDSIFIVDLDASYTLDTIRGCAPLDIRVSSIVQDAISSEFLPGEYSISDPSGQDVIVTFNKGGILQGPVLLVTDRHGCKDTFQTSVPIEVSKIKAQIASDNVICIPVTAQFFDESVPGLGNLIHRRWSLSYENQISDLPNPSFEFQIQGNYNIRLFLEDSWGCKDSVQKEILAVPLIPGFSSDTISCTAREVRLKTETDNSFVNAYLWNFGDGSVSTEKNPLHQFSQEGIYDICVEMFDSRGCSKSICKKNHIRIVNPTAAFKGDPLSAPCPPLLTNFLNESTIANKFTWDFGDNSGLSYNANPSHVYTLPGSFNVVLYAEMMPGCVDTLVRNAYVNLLGPKADMDFNITGNCVPLEVKLSATADKLYTFIWDYGDGKINEVPTLIKTDTTTYLYETPGKYAPKLLVSDDAGCSRTFTIDPIIVNEIKTSFVTNPEPICGLPAQIDIVNLTTSSSTDLNFKWLLSGGSTYESNTKDPAFTIESYGKYTISLISSTINCIDTLVKDSIIEVAAIPDLSFAMQSMLNCENTPLLITNTSEIEYGNVIDWTWDFGNGSFSKEQQPEIIFTKSGQYNIKLKAITNKGCKDSTEQYFNILPNTLLTLSDDKTICLGDSIDISAKIISNLPDYTFHWINDPTILCILCENANVKPLKTTTYFFETESQNGCINSDSIVVTVIPIAGPTLVLSADTITCEGGSVEISVTNVDPNYDYQWDTKDAGLNCYDNCTKVKASPLENTYYSILVTNIYGCYKEDSILVNVEKVYLIF